MKRFMSVLLFLVLVSAAGVWAAPGNYGPYKFSATTVLISSRGVDIPAVLTLPQKEGKVPLVVMAHGHGGSKEENGGLTAIAETLAIRGVASIRMDFPGCGASIEPFTQNNVTNMLADMESARAYACAKASIDPANEGVFGYSMGGRLAVLSAAKGYRSMGLLAPVSTDGPDPMFVFMGGKDKYVEMAAKAKADGHYLFTTPYGQVQDLSAKWFADNEEAKGLAAVSAFTGPILFVTGSADVIIPMPVIQATAAAAVASSGIEIVSVPGADHGYGFYGGDPAIMPQVVESVASFFALTLR
ncbi:MAG: alpha/beta fold hydrolase [Spirochaetes bacterium]|nr:alpha/beta fold hydrolase [Spirochaetota bacterium]